MGVQCLIASLLLGTVTVTAAIPGPEGCVQSRCQTYDDLNTLWCHTDPQYFCQCRPEQSGRWVVQVMPCAPGTVYSFRHQVCVHPTMQNPEECDGPTTGPTPPGTLLICEEQPCVTYAEVNTLWCHRDHRDAFCQCRPLLIDPKVWAPIVMPCADSTSFSFKHQVCVHDGDWTNSC